MKISVMYIVTTLLLIQMAWGGNLKENLEESYKNGKFEECISLANLILSTSLYDDLEKLEAHNYKGLSLIWQNKFVEAKKVIDESSDLKDKYANEDLNIVCIQSLYTEAWYLHLTGNPNEALRLYERCLVLLAENHKNNVLYFSTLNKIGEINLYYLKNEAASEKYLDKALMGFKVNYPNSIELSICYYSNSVLNRNLLNYDVADAYAQKALKYTSDYKSILPRFYASSLNLVSSIFYETGNTKEAIKWINKSIDFRKEINDYDRSLKIAYNNLLLYLQLDDQFSELENQINQAESIYSTNQKDSYEYGMLLFYSAYLAKAQNEEQLYLEKMAEAILIFQRTIGKENNHYTRLLFDRARFYQYKSLHKAALKDINEAINLLKKNTVNSVEEQNCLALADYYNLKIKLYHDDSLHTKLNDLLTIDSLLVRKRILSNWSKSKLDMSKKYNAVYNDIINTYFRMDLKNGNQDNIENIFKHMERNKSLGIWEIINRHLINERLSLNSNTNENYDQIISKLKIESQTNLNKDSILIELDFYSKKRQNLIDKINNNLIDKIPFVNNIEVKKITEMQAKLNSKSYILSFYKADSMLYCLTIGNEVITLKGLEIGDELNEAIHFVMGSLAKPNHQKSLAYENHSNIIFNAIESLSNQGVFRKGNYVTIVPDDFLFHIPIEALCYKKGESQNLTFKNLHYLLNIINVSYAPSISIWNYLIESDKRQKKEHSLNNFLILKDSLQGALKETHEINKLLPSYDDVTFLKKDELLEEVKAASYLHVASHAIIDTSKSNGNYILLNSGSQELFLYDYEILNTKFKLKHVYLNACSTNKGKNINGEGILSIANAFLASNVRTIIANIWDVSDKASASISILYYKFLIKKKKSPSLALSLSKRQYIRENGDFECHPYYWAGTVSIGANANYIQSNFKRYLPMFVIFIISFILLIKRKL